MLNFLNERKTWVLPVVLALLTFACHVAFSLWFWTASPTFAPKTSLAISGEEYLKSFPTWDTENEADAAYYNRGAVEVLRTGVPRTRSGLFFEHAPFYAYFLAACYKLGGLRLVAVVVPQALLNGFTCLLVGLTATRLAPRHAALAGFFTSSLVLISLRFAGFAGHPGPTTLLLFLFALAFWAAVASPDNRIRPLFLVAMVLAAFTQAAFFVIALAAVAWLVLRFWQTRSWSFLAGAACLLVFSLAKPLVTVLYRTGQPASSQAPTAILWEANNPYYESMTAFSLWERRPGNNWSKWKLTAEQTARYEDYLRRADGNGTRAALLWIRENPRDYLDLCVVRFGAALGPVTGQMSPLNQKISVVLWLLVFPAGLLAMWRYRHLPSIWLAVLVIVAELSFESVIMAGWQPRYRLPIELMLMVFAGVVYALWLGGWLENRPPATKSAVSRDGKLD